MAKLLLTTPLSSVAFQSGRSELQYKIDHRYEPYNQSQHNDEPLHRILYEMDPDFFPSPNQARKAILHGRLLVLQSNNDVSSHDIPSASDKVILNLGTVANSTTVLQDEDVVAVRSRLPNDFYPQSCTNFVDPPSNVADLITMGNVTIFEDDHIAIVNKPEGIDTIGEKRNDLQSALPFMLRPPKILDKKVRKSEEYSPRPIHRLDRQTSGCVLVAKSSMAMTKFSGLFSTRQIQKSYCAITFGEPKLSKSECVDVDGNTYSIIDYPINGKDAVTLWRVVTTVTSATWGTLSLLHLLPKTGRNHQIRRHLSYCISCPIVGDSKYDGGGQLAKAARGLGMFLCSNSIQFAHVMLEDESNVVADIPLTDKYYEILGLTKDDDVI